jgi:hypothetical protein
VWPIRSSNKISKSFPVGNSLFSKPLGNPLWVHKVLSYFRSYSLYYSSRALLLTLQLSRCQVGGCIGHCSASRACKGSVDIELPSWTRQRTCKECTYASLVTDSGSIPVQCLQLAAILYSFLTALRSMLNGACPYALLQTSTIMVTPC